jgi:hypothetical protein
MPNIALDFICTRTITDGFARFSAKQLVEGVSLKVSCRPAEEASTNQKEEVGYDDQENSES